MEAIKLVLTEAFLFRKEDAQAIRDALSLSVPVSEPSWHVRCSIDPPQFIELLGSVDTWEILKPAAQAFLLAFGGALGKKAADSTAEAIQNKWRRMVKKRQDKHLSSLNNLATTLKSISDRSDREVGIEIGLNIPDDVYGTTLSTHAKDPVEFIRVLSIFIVNAEKIYAGLRSALDNENAQPVGWICIKLEDNGSIILRWRSDRDNHMKRII